MLRRLLLLTALLCPLLVAQEKPEGSRGPINEATLQGLRFRSIGPAIMSGRIGDFAVNPKDRSQYYVAVSSGGVWRTNNAGTTWIPVFDSQSSFSIGCVTMDPGNPNVVWVGTGENNSQRSVSWGDGVYRTEDGGKNWQNMGLKNSEHIGKILIDPRNSSVVYVAAQGPLWGPGGDRGLYKTTDDGQTWKAMLTVDKHTGVSDVVMDPRNADLLYAASYQRRRHVWTLIDGGPGSAIHRSTNGGATWKKLAGGLPTVDLGRIGLAVSPVNPDIVYATIEAAMGQSGFFRSTDRGATWERRSETLAGSPQYYQEIICDPVDVDRVYLMDVYLKVSDDAGKSFRNLGEKSKHVDNHAMWIDPANPSYYLVGCDGGIYESFDRGENWNFKANLPVTQFYRVSVDKAIPFYHVLGGTQDNSSVRGPSRTISANGITNADWVITTGGDGFESAIDPENPDIVYAQSQHGGLVRFDARSGERTGIKPLEGKDERPLRWNWDSPLIVSPHSPTRLYFAANRLFRSDDRGDSWKAVSPDLSRQIDRNTLPVMDRVWSIDAVAKNASTSYYGNIVALSESPLRESLLYAGTDDGLVQVTENGGQQWRTIDQFPGVPAMTYVSRLETSRHSADRVYAAFDNHKNADFTPYVLRSDDRGKTWKSISSNLPHNGPVYAIVEDHKSPDLLFVGTEFGVFVTLNAGIEWVRLKGGVPTIAVRDIAIQERENDLVLGTFGRGFYVFDDYSPLRAITPERLKKEADLFPVKDAVMFVPSRPYGGRGKATQGEAFYAAENPPVGAVITCFVKEPLKSLKEIRQESEKELVKKNLPVPYPTPDQVRAEETEEAPQYVLTITDEMGDVVRRLTVPNKKGISRVVWDFRYPSQNPVQRPTGAREEGGDAGQSGVPAVPGKYRALLAKRVQGVTTELAGPVEFNTVPLGLTTLPVGDRRTALAFYQKVSRLQRAVLGASRLVDELKDRLVFVKRAHVETPGASAALGQSIALLERDLQSVERALRGDRAWSSRNEPIAPSVVQRTNVAVENLWQSNSAPTKTQEDAYAVAGEEFAPVLARLKKLIEEDLRGVEAGLERAGAPWTPGRVPEWKTE